MSIPSNSGEPNGLPLTPVGANPPGVTDAGLPHRRRIRVLLVDPTRLTRECLADYLREWSPDLDVQIIEDISEAGAEQVVKPDVVVVNIKASAADEPAIRHIASILAAALGADIPALIVSEREEVPEEGLEAVRLGIRGFFPADLGMGLLIAAIRLIAWGGVFISPATISRQVTRLFEPERSAPPSPNAINRHIRNDSRG